MIYVKRGDTQPLDRTLKRGGSAIDLTAATVEFHMTQREGSKEVSGACSLLSAAAGQVRFTWGGTDTDTVGDYDVEWEVTYSNGKVETVPNFGYADLRVVQDLG